MLLKNYIGTQVSAFLATPVALHLTPVSGTVGRSAEFWTSIVSRLVSLFYSWKNESICKVVLASWQGALQSFWCQPPDNSCAPLRSTHRLDLSRIFLVQCHQNIVNFTAALKLSSPFPVWCKSSVWCRKVEAGVCALSLSLSTSSTLLCFPLSGTHHNTSSPGMRMRIFSFGKVKPHQWQMVSWRLWY